MIDSGEQSSEIVELQQYRSKYAELCDLHQKTLARLQGYESLNSTLNVQTETIRDLRAKVENYKSALSQSECQLSKLLRIKGAVSRPASASVQGGNGAGYYETTPPLPPADLQPRGIAQPQGAADAEERCDLESDGCRQASMRPSRIIVSQEKQDDCATLESDEAICSTLEADGDVGSSTLEADGDVGGSSTLEADGDVGCLSSYSHQHDPFTVDRPDTKSSSSPPLRFKADDKPIFVTSSRLPSFVAKSGKPTLVIATGLAPVENSERKSFTSATSNRPADSAKVHGERSPNLSSSVGENSYESVVCPSTLAFISGVRESDASPDLVKKLMSQNARLKKVMRDILQCKGMTLSEYLDKQEYEDVVEQLRQELRQSRATVAHLNSLLASQNNNSDNNNSGLRESQLVQTIAKLEKSVLIHKAMVASYSDQLTKLQREKSLLSPRRSDEKLSSAAGRAEEKIEQLNKELREKTEQLRSALGQIEVLKSELSSFKHYCVETVLTHKQELNVWREKNTALTCELQRYRQRDESESHSAPASLHSLLPAKQETLMSDLATKRRDLMSKIGVKQETKQESVTSDLATKRKELMSKIGVKQETKEESVTSDLDTKEKNLMSHMTANQATERKSVTSDLTTKGNPNLMSYLGAKHEAKQESVTSDVAAKGNHMMSDIGAKRKTEQESATSDLATDGCLESVDSRGFGEMLICERCDREFIASERSEFKKHVEKCTDD